MGVRDGLGRLDVEAKALRAAPRMSMAKIDEAAKNFESMFLAQMLESMFTESSTGVFGDEDSRDIYKGLMVDQYAKEIASSGGIGIASYIKKELLALQEVAS